MKRVGVGVGNPFMFDPFQILNLEKSYSLDLTVLEKHYFAEQKKSHPDQFSQADEEKKADALKKSTALNQAYLILKNPLLRAEYLLEEAGIEKLAHDPSFLGKVMTWNERLERGEELTSEFRDEEVILLKTLDKAFSDKDYEKARMAVYSLTYVQQLIKRGRR